MAPIPCPTACRLEQVSSAPPGAPPELKDHVSWSGDSLRGCREPASSLAAHVDAQDNAMQRAVPGQVARGQTPEREVPGCCVVAAFAHGYWASGGICICCRGLSRSSSVDFQTGQGRTAGWVCITAGGWYWLTGDIFHWHEAH